MKPTLAYFENCSNGFDSHPGLGCYVGTYWADVRVNSVVEANIGALTVFAEYWMLLHLWEFSKHWHLQSVRLAREGVAQHDTKRRKL